MENLVVLSSSETIEEWELELLWEGTTLKTKTKKEFIEKTTFRKAKEDFERKFISKSLKRNDRNVSKTADELGLNRSHLHEKMKTLDIHIKKL